MPSPSIATPGEDRIDGVTVTGQRSTSSLNAVTGRDADGRPVILMPTQARDPARLTDDDRRARDAQQAAMPDARIVPIGGRSALTGSDVMADGYNVACDWGTHCLRNVLPLVIAPR